MAGTQRRWLVRIGSALLVATSGIRGASAAEVAWIAPITCKDERPTVEEAERLLGRSLGEVSSVDFEVRVEQEPDQRWSLRLATVERASHERRERVFVGTSCDEVAAAAGVAMAMAVSGIERAPEPEPRAPTEPEPASQPEARSAEPVASAKGSGSSPGARASRVSAALSLAAVGDVGSLPGASPGAELGASLRSGALQLSLLGAFHVGSRRVTAGKGADFDLALLGVLACGRWGVGRGRLLACVGAEGGRLGASGVGLKNPRSDGSFWWAPRADIGLSWPVSRAISLFGRLGAALPRARKEFVVDGDLFVHRPSALAARAAFGVELALE